MKHQRNNRKPNMYNLKGMEISFHNLLFLSHLFLFPLLLIIFSMTQKLKSGGLKLPPAPYAWPIVGNLFNMDGKKPHIALSNLAKTLGPLFSLRFGSMIVVVASNSDAAREVYKFHDKELSGRYVLQASKKVPGVNDSVIVMAQECDERWRSLRVISHTELFSSQALESQSHMRIDKVRKMLQFLSSKEGEVVRIADIIFGTIVNSLSMAMTSKDLIQNLDNIQETKLHITNLLLVGIPGLGDLYPVLYGLDFGINQKVNAYINVMNGLWRDIVAERRRRGQDCGKEGRTDLLDCLIKSSWDDMQIYNLLTEFFVGGESMTTVSEWAIAELTRIPEALVKLREELDEAMGEGKVLQEHEISKLPFLQACLKETLRLHPPSPFLVPRVAVETCKVMNYDIPKGCLIITNEYALGRDPKVWKDPNSFKPERFLGKSIDVKGTNYELMPFGGGKRICAGYPLALRHMPLLLASIVSAFDWSAPDEMDQYNNDMGEKFCITLRKEKPMQLILKKRSNFKIE